jgi:MoaA/NifB/PqqE/SkfB family radical SAM enzyme
MTATRPATLAALGWLGLRALAARGREPIVGSVILTDRCNLHCQHCAVANIRAVNYPFETVCADMRALYGRGVRILFLYGGEPFLWRDRGLRLVDVVAEARRIGFLLVNVVTNGTRGVDLPGVDVMMVSVDGARQHHDAIRGRTYDLVMANIAAAPEANIVAYMAINRINRNDIGHICQLAADQPNIRGAAFNFHTPYPGTEHLGLTRAEKRECAELITGLKAQGYPVLDLVSVLPDIVANTSTGPCKACLIREDGQEWVCGRCAEIPGLCQSCGFFFATELTALLRGRPAVVLEALRTYRAYI